MKNILLLEDDESLNRGISFKLKKEGYTIFSAYDIANAKQLFSENEINLIISDINLPDGNGLDFCQEVREKSEVFIIFLTALDTEIDIVNGYDVGGDDYVTKPFSLIVLISKVNALMRRVKNNKVAEKIISGSLSFYPDEMKVTKDNEEVILSKNELKLLKYFMDNAKQIVTKEQLLSALWDIDGQFVDENTVAVNIRRLREKVEDTPSSPKYIKNVRGIGYIWNEGCVKSWLIQ